MKLLSLGIETLMIGIENQEKCMTKMYTEQKDYGKMYGQEQYLDGPRKALLLVREVYAANDIEHFDKGKGLF